MDRSIGALVESRRGVLVWTIVLGFALVVLSFILDFAAIRFTGQLRGGFNVFSTVPPVDGMTIVPAKEVGFLMALNWSAFCTFIAPLIVWFGLSTTRCFEATLEALCEKGMVRDGEFRRVSYKVLGAKWKAHNRKNRLLFLTILVAVIAFVMSDWWSVVASPLLNPAAVSNPLSDPKMEYDWSVSALFVGVTVDQMALLVFSFVAYLLFAGLVPALVIAVTVCTIYFMLFVTTVRLGEENKEGEEVQFAAVPASEDDRHFGFKVFAPLFDNYLLMSLFIMVGLWLMAVQNVYLRDPYSSDIIDFVLGDITQYTRLLDNSGGVMDFVAWFVAPTRFTIPNIQVALSVLLMPAICVVSIAGSWYILRNKAIAAGKLSRKHVTKLARELKVSYERLDERLAKDMEVWPVGWISSRKLLAMMAFLFVALVSYRLIIVPVVFGGFISLWSLLAILIERRKGG